MDYLKKIGYFTALLLPSALLWAESIPNTVVTCTAASCPTIAPILGPNETLKDQVIIYQTSNNPEFMRRSTTKFSAHNNGGWQQIILNQKDFSATHAIIGFGGAFTDSTAMLYHAMPSALKKNFVQAYFSPQGLNYSLGRVPMASSDFSCRNSVGVPNLEDCDALASQYSYTDNNDPDLKKFALQLEDVQFKIPLIQSALTANQDLKLFASPWSGPAWMKTNGSMVHGALIPSLQQNWANYFVKFLQAYKDKQINFWAVTAQNEPEEYDTANQKAYQTWQTMYFTKEQEAEFIKLYLGPALQSFKRSDGGKVQLMMHDDQITSAKTRVTMLEDKSLAEYIAGAGLHWYMNGDTNYSNLDTIYKLLQANHPGSFILGTEACEGYNPIFPGTDFGSWVRGEAYGHDIINDINHHVSGWTDWNLALDMRGGPNWAKNRVDAPILVDVAKQTFYQQPMYFYLGHFSKFIRPGARLLASQSNGPFPLEEVSFKVDAQPGLPATIVIVVMNRDVSGRTYFIRDDSLPTENRYINLNIPSHAIQTIIYHAVG